MRATTIEGSLDAHEVRTVPEEGWSGIENGELLRAAEPSFDVFITVDRKLPRQQNLGSLNLVVALLKAPSNDIDDLLPLIRFPNELHAGATDCDPPEEGASVR